VFCSVEPGVPQKVKLANEGQVKLEASWMPPLLPNGKLTGYKVSCGSSHESGTPILFQILLGEGGGWGEFRRK
jgi:hypothetical protein